MANRDSNIFKELTKEQIKKIIELNFGENIKYKYESFLSGYGYLESKDEKTLIRKKIYKLFYSVVDCYVWKVQYNNEEAAKENKDSALKLFKELAI